ncbi:MAG TPA: hypothetical protein VE074_16725 [Jatrophihabitantaceae bacterium]|nr:hypothetical protein [Jatrophihabitantaceae bacterium]
MPEESIFDEIGDAISSEVSAVGQAASDVVDGVAQFGDTYAHKGIGQAVEDATGLDGRAVDHASAVAWDVAGVIPGVDLVAAGVGFGLDAGAGAYDAATGDLEGAQNRANAAALDAVGGIPVVGTAVSAVALGYDAVGLGADLGGVDIPTSGEQWNKGAAAVDEAIVDAFDGSGGAAPTMPAPAPAPGVSPPEEPPPAEDPYFEMPVE